MPTIQPVSVMQAEAEVRRQFPHAPREWVREEALVVTLARRIVRAAESREYDPAGLAEELAQRVGFAVDEHYAA